MSVELRHLRYFVAVAEELSFRKAAKRLHIAKPPLGRQIRDLEEEIGTPLFDRSRNHVRLTGAGQVFLVGARETLEAVARAIAGTRKATRSAVPVSFRIKIVRFVERKHWLFSISETTERMYFEDLRFEAAFCRLLPVPGLAAPQTS